MGILPEVQNGSHRRNPKGIPFMISSPSRFALAGLTTIFLLSSFVGCSKDETATVASLKALKVLVVPDGKGKAAGVNMLPTDPAKLDEAIDLVCQLGGVKTVTALEGVPMTNDHLAKLGRIKSLVQIDINDGSITDEGIAHLTGLGNLESLTVANNAVTDGSMASFAKMKKLNMLNLNGTQVKGGYDALAGLSNLQWMLLGGVKISDADATAISNFPAITHVTLKDSTDISEAGVKALKSNKKCTVDYANDAPFAGESDQ